MEDALNIVLTMCLDMNVTVTLGGSSLKILKLALVSIYLLRYTHIVVKTQ